MKVPVAIQPVEPTCALRREHICDVRRYAVGPIIVARIDSQRTAMSFQFLDIDHRKTVTRQHRHRGAERKIRIMLMINRVELAAVDETQQVRELQRDDATRLERDGKVFIGDFEPGRFRPLTAPGR